jgi:PAS domain S-box-containing protein
LIFYKDINSVYIGCNKAFEEFVGMTEKDIIGYNDFELFDKDMAQMFRDMDLEMIRQGKPRRNEEWVRYPEGKKVLLDTLKTLYYDPQGNVLGLIGISRDITEKNKKEKLQKSVDEKRREINELREYDKIKTEFFANISHELRTPINVIFSALQMHEFKLRDSSFLNNPVDKYIGMMKQNCYRILRLIDNLIDITKIDSGHFQINEVNCNIIRLIENVALSAAQFIKDKGLTLIFDTNIEEKIIACDPEKIERIILNLLSNAVKFIESGGIINFNIEDKGDSICIIVKDNGRGIPDEKINHIFDRFVQVDKSLTRNHEGSGIGLSIVKALVELHGGSVKVFSQLGKGSEFIIELPVKILEDDQLLEYSSYEKNSTYYLNKLNVEFSDIYF